MAVVDERWSGSAVRPAQPTTFDRQPPQDLAAEQSVLGGMLMSKDAIADVIEALRSGDFYKPAHTLVFDAVLNLYSRGEPADTITVAAELDKAGSLSRIGGAVYLHTLMATVPTAANAGYYAQIVAEKAILRRLVEAGTRIVQLGYGGSEGDVGGGEVDEIVDRAQAEITGDRSIGPGRSSSIRCARAGPRRRPTPDHARRSTDVGHRRSRRHRSNEMTCRSRADGAKSWSRVLSERAQINVSVGRGSGRRGACPGGTVRHERL